MKTAHQATHYLTDIGSACNAITSVSAMVALLLLVAVGLSFAFGGRSRLVCGRRRLACSGRSSR